MISTQGTIPFPAADSEAVMVLATNLTRMAVLMEANVQAYSRGVVSTVDSRRWSGAAADGFAAASRRRTDHAARAAASLRAAGEALVRHGSVIYQTSQAYETAAVGEQYLRRNYPTAAREITASMEAEAHNLASLYRSVEAIAPVIQEAINEFSQMINRANVDAIRPDVQREIDGEKGIGLIDIPIVGRAAVLDRIERGTLTPDPASRLGAYAATVGYPPGSTGNAVHRAIGTIYGTLGTLGEEQIGTVFNSPQARELFDKPLTEQTSRQIAEIEYGYWTRVREANGFSVGGNLGSAVNPTVRDFLQRELFATKAKAPGAK
jgi:hypothetical protein